MEQLMSEEEIAQALKDYAGIPEASAEDWLMDALSIAPVLLGFPAMMGKTPKIPKVRHPKFAKQLEEGVPKSLHEFATTEESVWQLSNFSDMTLTTKDIAPIDTKRLYRPAVRLEDGTVLWHPKARIHADTITMQPEVKRAQSFDYGAIADSGGIGPDGHYYKSEWIGDVFVDMEAKGIEDISGSWGAGAWERQAGKRTLK